MGIDVRIQLFNSGRYRSSVLPAIEQWRKTGKTAAVVTQLEAARERIPERADDETGLWPVPLSNERIDRCLRLLKAAAKATGRRSATADGRRVASVADVIAAEVAPVLVESCLEWQRGFNPDQDLTDSPIVEYLRDRSEWIRDSVIMLGPLEGGRLEYSPGEGSHLFSPAEARRFRAELARVEPTDDEVDPENHFENLARILDAAVETEGLALLRTLT